MRRLALCLMAAVAVVVPAPPALAAPTLRANPPQAAPGDSVEVSGTECPAGVNRAFFFLVTDPAEDEVVTRTGIPVGADRTWRITFTVPANLAPGRGYYFDAGCGGPDNSALDYDPLDFTVTAAGGAPATSSSTRPSSGGPATGAAAGTPPAALGGAAGGTAGGGTAGGGAAGGGTTPTTTRATTATNRPGATQGGTTQTGSGTRSTTGAAGSSSTAGSAAGATRSSFARTGQEAILWAALGLNLIAFGSALVFRYGRSRSAGAGPS